MSNFRRRLRRSGRALGPVLAPDTGPVPEWSARRLPPRDVPVPEYGSDEWLALADNDPAKVAATVAAAEAWRITTHPAAVADRLQSELNAARYVADREAEAAAQLAFQCVAATVASNAGRPSYAELAELRGQPERAARAREQQAEVDATFTTHLRTAPTPERTPLGAPSTPAGRAARARRLAETSR